MVEIEEKCLLPFDETFYQEWFKSQFPIKCFAQIIMIEHLLKDERAQQALTNVLEKEMDNVYHTFIPGESKESKHWKEINIQNVLFKNFTTNIIIELFANTITPTMYNILTFKDSKIIKCLKDANKSLANTYVITDEIIDTEVLKSWFMKAINRNFNERFFEHK